MKNSEKTVMIVTWCNADNIVNYGQVLQGCAMAKIISKMNFKKVILVSYRERKKKEIIDYLYLHYMPFMSNSKSNKRTREFVRGVMQNANVEFHQVFSEKRVDRIAQGAEILICGSDQIWHPIEYNKVLFLDIGKKDAKRIAYAASQPMGKIYPEYKKTYQKMKKHLKAFDAISIREKGAIPLIKELSQKEVQNVLDPTLLVSKEEWDILSEEIDVPKEYILMYIPAQMNKLAIDVVKFLKTKMKINNIICLAPRSETRIKGVKYLDNVSVGQFIYLIKNAKTVCTSSFHGVIFSIIFEKQFWCFKWRFSDRRSDLRLGQITEIAGLQERLIKDIEDINIDKKIDFETCNQKIKKEIEKSYEFLNTMI